MVSARARSKFAALSVATALLAAACGSAASTADAPEAETPESEAPTSTEISIPNAGTTDLEGHTPRGFAGMGVGLFAGDNLNPNFPNGEGIQILLHFALPEGTTSPGQAILRSDVLSTSGDALDALGPLRAARVEYDAFGPELFNIEPVSDLVVCELPTESSLSCDITESATAAIDAGRSSVQIQLTLELLSDNDGEQDLVLFNNGDSNLNEPGLFTLDLS